MPVTEPTWTAERLALLKTHFDAGMSCRQIAADLGVSRNAVIGKLSRLNLRRDYGPPRRTARKPAAATPGTPRAQYDMLVAAYGDEALTADNVVIDHTNRCTLFELSAQKCRWPISTPGAEDFCFCGNTPLDGLPYCAGHTRLAYKPGSRLRVGRG